jgi:hypothetical protein
VTVVGDGVVGRCRVSTVSQSGGTIGADLLSLSETQMAGDEKTSAGRDRTG